MKYLMLAGILSMYLSIFIAMFFEKLGLKKMEEFAIIIFAISLVIVIIVSIIGKIGIPYYYLY